MPDPAFWSRRHVLVTGADGFIGSHLTERLVSYGARVSAYVRGSSTSGTVRYELRNIAHLEPSLHAVLAGNLASPDAAELIADLAPEVVMHLAAEAYVPKSFAQPREVLESNLMGTLNVLHAAKANRAIRRVVATSSSEIYGTTEGERIDERHPFYPTSPYAASKVACDRLCYAYHRTYGLPVAIVRPFNTFGPRHVYDVIPKFLALALRGEPITVHGTGEQSRDFTYVDDMVDAFLTMGEHPDAVGAAINFGTGRDVTINEVARAVKELTGSPSEIVHVEDRAAQVDRLCCDARLAQSLGWRAKVPFREGLRRNVEWARTAWGAGGSGSPDRSDTNG